MSISLVKSQTMSSTEIATLTGKEKKNVHRDIRIQILEGLYEIKDGSDLSHIKIQGVTATFDERGYVSDWHLDKEHTLTLITGYDVKMRHAINKHWLELEQRASRPLTANEILAQSAMALVEHDRRLSATEIEVKQVAAKVAQISVDLRNGVPHGFISRKNAKSIYGKGLSQTIFEEAMTALAVPTKVMCHLVMVIQRRLLLIKKTTFRQQSRTSFVILNRKLPANVFRAF